jgi:hypothetical protein
VLAASAVGPGRPALGAQPVAAAPRVLCVRDAGSTTPTPGAAWIGGGDAALRTDAAGCVRADGARGRLAAPGRRTLLVRTDTLRADTTVIALHPVAQPLPATDIVAAEPVRGALAAPRTVDEARATGATTMAQLAGTVPYLAARGARGDVAVSLRGARSEQTLVTLDGLPLTDPATGAADIGDLPLVLLGQVTARPGADGAGAGLGAVGGVLAFESGRGTTLAGSHGAWGRRQVEGAWEQAGATAHLRAGGAWLEARDDFPVRAAPDIALAPTGERRVNNDRTRLALFAHGAVGATQWLVLGSRAGQGLVGPVGVRANDADRSHTTRGVVRVAHAVGAGSLMAGVRVQRLDFRDPTRPVLDTRTDVVSADLETTRPLPIRGRPLVARAGVGHDAAWSAPRTPDGGAPRLVQARPRGWIAVGVAGRAGRADLRADAVRGTTVTPSLSLATQRRLVGRWRATGRLGQALRVPTLYDLWFASPQRIQARVLRPERVVADAELALHHQTPAVALEGALVAREVRDAIIWFPGNFGWSPDNVGRERVHGAEGRARAAVGGAGWQLTAELWGSWLEAELRSGALTIPTPYVPRRSGGGVLRLARGAAHGALTWRAMGRRPFTRGPRDAAFELPAVAVADLALGLERRVAGAPLRLVLAAENVFDAPWEGVRGFPAPPRSWSLQFTLHPTVR